MAKLASTALALLLHFAGGVLAAPGDLDLTFAPNPENTVWSMAVQPDGRILVGGNFVTIAGAPRANLARLHPDGSLDTTFTATTDSLVLSLAVQPDGRILIGGPFTMVNGVIRRSAARLHADGTLDDSFQPDPRRLAGPQYPQEGGSLYDWNDDVSCIALQPDGKVLIGGNFATVGTTARRGIARFHADGSLDTSFDPGANDGASVGGLAIQPDGRVLMSGSFTTIGGVPRSRLVRLEANGTLDTTFNPGADDWVGSFAFQPDGKIVIGGGFWSIGGIERVRLARLNADGTLDATFNAGMTATYSSHVSTVALQADGKILVFGEFSQVAGATRRKVARLHSDGTLESGFNPPNAGLGTRGLAMQGDGQVLLGGFHMYFGPPEYDNMVRLGNDPATQQLEVTSASRIQWLRGGAAPETRHVTFDLSTDGGTSWSPLGAGSRIADGWEIEGLTLPVSGRVRARAVVTGGWSTASSGLVEKVALFPVTAPMVSAGSASSVTTNSATLGGTVVAQGADATVLVEYGTSASYGSSVAASPALIGALESSTVNAALTGLLPHTTYHFRLVATNAQGSTTGTDATFTTLNTPPVTAADSISLVSGRPASLAVLANDTDDDGDPLAIASAAVAQHGAITIRDGALLYTPNAGFVGTDSFSYVVSDGFGGTANGTVTLTVLARPTDPVVTLLARKGGAVPDAGVPGSGATTLPTGSTWLSLGIPAINDLGRIAFVASVKISATRTASAIVTADEGACTIVAKSGDAAPGVTGGIFASFANPVLAQDGATAFLATLGNAAGQSAVTAASKHGIWSNAYSAAPQLVARTGTQAIGVRTGVRWSTFVSIALADGVSGPLFVGKLAGTGVSVANDTGFWGMDSTGALRLLLRSGDTIEGKRVQSFLVLPAMPAVPGQTRSFNQVGEVMARVTFTDGTQGLVKITVP